MVNISFYPKRFGERGQNGKNGNQRTHTHRVREKEQSKIICYRMAKIEMKPTNQSQQWQQQQKQYAHTSFLFSVLFWCNQQRNREHMNEK